MENMVHDGVQNYHQKEGEEAAGPLAKLPIEWLVQVIYWLPTQFIFTIMCVNREWECACRYVIKWRKSLEVTFQRRSWPAASVFTIRLQCNAKSWNKERAGQVRSSLRQMRNLIHFADHTGFTGYKAIRRGWLHEITFQNAASLKFLKHHRLFDDGFVTYSKLMELQCSFFDATSAARLCPRLENLTVFVKVLSPHSPPLPSLKVVTTRHSEDGIPLFLEKNATSLEEIRFDRLPAFRFPKLKILKTRFLPDAFHVPSLQSVIWSTAVVPDSETPADFFLDKITTLCMNFEVVNQSSLNQAITRVSAMENMTRLDLRIRCGPLQYPVPDLFANLHNLDNVTVHVCLPFDHPARVFPAATWASSLFTNNRNLRAVELRGIQVTDEDLVLCSKLKKLSKVNLGIDKNHGFTVSGIMALLRGASRSQISKVSLTSDQNSLNIIDSEITEMEKERSVSFTRKVHERSSPIKIHFLHGPNPPPVVAGDGQVPLLEEVIQTHIRTIMTRLRCSEHEWMITKARGSLTDSFLSIPESQYAADKRNAHSYTERLNVVQEEMVFFVERINVPGPMIPIIANYCIMCELCTIPITFRD
jgi:hypothetical protein